MEAPIVCLLREQSPQKTTFVRRTVINSKLRMNSKAQKELTFVKFWDDRYAKQDGLPTVVDEDYEWFRTFAQLRSFLERHLPSSSTNPQIIQLGCGTSVSISLTNLLDGHLRMLNSIHARHSLPICTKSVIATNSALTFPKLLSTP